MTNLEFINQNIFECENFIEHLENKIIENKEYPSLVKDYKERIEELKPILNQLQQIKTILEAWETTKRELALEIIEHYNDTFKTKYALKCDYQGLIPLLDKEVESFKKALEVSND